MRRISRSVSKHDPHAVVFRSAEGRNEVTIARDENRRGDLSRKTNCEKIDCQLNIDALLFKDGLTGLLVDPAKLKAS